MRPNHASACVTAVWYYLPAAKNSAICSRSPPAAPIIDAVLTFSYSVKQSRPFVIIHEPRHNGEDVYLAPMLSFQKRMPANGVCRMQACKHRDAM